MAPEQKELLALRNLPARLTVDQAAHLLGFQSGDIPILVEAALLQPLGRPPLNASKYFAASTVATLRGDERWLARATDAIHRHWKKKNLAKRNPGRTNGTSSIHGPI